MPLSDYRHIVRILHTIIRKSSHYQQTVWHFQNIVTLSAGFHDVIRVSSHYQQVSMMLSEYRHLSDQSPCHYQSIVTLSADSTSLSEYRNIISRLHVIIRVSTHYQHNFHFHYHHSTMIFLYLHYHLSFIPHNILCILYFLLRHVHHLHFFLLHVTI